MSGSLQVPPGVAGGIPSGVPGGGIPPGMRPPTGPPGNLGPVSVPHANPGNILQAAQHLAVAHQALLQALPAIPLGTPLHEKIQKLSTDLGKTLAETGEQVRMTTQTLMGLMQQQRNQPQMAAVQQMMQPRPNMPPATPPPSAMTSPSAAGA